MARSDDTPLALMAVAEQVLTNSFGGVTHLAEPEPLDASPRSTVYRCAVLAASRGAPISVIVKRAGGEGETYDPNAAEEPTTRLFNEWAGLQFLDHLADAASPAARFYGGDRAAGLVVLEDLGTDGHLNGILLGCPPSCNGMRSGTWRQSVSVSSPGSP